MFRHSSLWRSLRRRELLRSGLYLALELRSTVREPQSCRLEVTDSAFKERRDPWCYETSAAERDRFVKQTELLDEARDGRLFDTGLEIGCAEGLYTEVIADRCESLLVLDISPTALARARSRRAWTERVRFGAFDLRSDAIPGTFDLVVITGVLEYFSRPTTFPRIREQLAGALRPGGYLLVETTRSNPVVENSWWGERLIRGKWINIFISHHPSLIVVSSVMTDLYAITLLRRAC